MNQWLIRLLWRSRFRGKSRLLSPLAPRSGVRMANVFGANVALDLSDLVQRLIYLGCYERQETRAVIRCLRPGMTFVDAGANIGYFSYLAASLVGPGGRVIAIEPDPMLSTRLADTVRANRLQSVSVLNVALGRSAGELPLSIPPPNLHNHSPTLTPVEGWRTVVVPIRPLDDVLDEHSIARVDLLKMDVEGFEAEILAGASRALAAGRIGGILCEFNDYWLRENGTTPDRLWDEIVRHGLEPVTPRPAFSPGVVVSGIFVNNRGAPH
jgi:FkbM family methyltransferase